MVMATSGASESGDPVRGSRRRRRRSFSLSASTGRNVSDMEKIQDLDGERRLGAYSGRVRSTFRAPWRRFLNRWTLLHLGPPSTTGASRQGGRRKRRTGSPGRMDLRSHGGAHLQLLLSLGGEDQHQADVLDTGLQGLAEVIGWTTSRGWGAGERRGWVACGEQHEAAATRLGSWAEWGTERCAALIVSFREV
jgi:hypothetical protein